MLVDERRHQIAQAVLAEGVATVAELSQRFGVSQVTIRSDLEALEAQGMLKRNRGGAVANRVLRFTPTFQQQTSLHRKEKAAIAAVAAKLPEDGDWAIVDAGSTTLYVAHNLRDRQLTVAVNSVYAINELVEAPQLDVIPIGGTLYKPSLCFVGPLGEAFLDGLHFDWLFLGVNGVSPRGVSVKNPYEAGFKRKMVEVADQVVVLADASKIGLDSFVFLAPLSEMNVLITDSKAPQRDIKLYRKSGTEVRIADA